MFELRTERLLLRTWQPADLRAFAALNGDRQVMEHFPSVMSRSQSDAMARRMQAHFVQFGFGYWVLERHEQPGLLGVLGLQQVAFAAPFTPAVEIGWRIQQAHWRRGYALEAARAVLACAFNQFATGAGVGVHRFGKRALASLDAALRHAALAQ
jgi:RimJ/RimL family protein N-acetyltransferase